MVGTSAAAPRRPGVATRLVGARLRDAARRTAPALLVALLAAPAMAEVRVVLRGLDGEVRDNVERALSIRRLDDDAGERRVERLHRQAIVEEIPRALEPFGFYRPTVAGDLERRGEDWTATYEVATGEPLPVAAVDVRVLGPDGEAVDDPRFLELARDFPLSPGETLDHRLYELGKSALIEYAARHGYLDAEVERAEVRVDLEAYEAAIDLVLRAGQRFRFGEVELVQDVVEPEFLQGYVTVEPGTPLDVRKLLALQDALSDSPYFSRVEVVPLRDEAEGLEVPIRVTLYPAKRRRWNLGAGYGTETGPRGSAKLDLRRLNRRGHRGSVDLVISDIEERLELKYLIPGAYPRTDVLALAAGFNDIEPGENRARSETTIIGATLTRSRGRWRERYALNFYREDFTLGLDSGVAELVVPEVAWTLVRADDRIFTLNGQKLELWARGADENLLSEESFVQFGGEIKAIASWQVGPLGAWPLRLIGRLNAGQIATEDFSELPPSFRFFAGGDGSVRGYGFRELGNLDAAGNVVGGQALLTGTVELDSLFFEKFGRWGAAVFYDFGNASTSFADDLRTGAGAGIRWLSPIGLVRVDAAWALDLEDRPLRLHVTIGPDL